MHHHSQSSKPHDGGITAIPGLWTGKLTHTKSSLAEVIQLGNYDGRIHIQKAFDANCLTV